MTKNRKDDLTFNIQLTKKSWKHWVELYKQALEYDDAGGDKDSAFLLGKLHSIFKLWALLIKSEFCKRDKEHLRLMLSLQLSFAFRALQGAHEGNLEEVLGGLFK